VTILKPRNSIWVLARPMHKPRTVVCAAAMRVTRREGGGTREQEAWRQDETRAHTDDGSARLKGTRNNEEARNGVSERQSRGNEGRFTQKMSWARKLDWGV